MSDPRSHPPRPLISYGEGRRHVCQRPAILSQTVAAAAFATVCDKVLRFRPTFSRKSAVMVEPHILIVDDARDIREPLATYLKSQGFRASVAADAPSGRSAVNDGAIDLVVLDVMMPGENGLSLCRYLRERGGPPVILLTAMADDADRIVGLELGADDYVVKPFNPRELLARIRAVLRRVTTAAPAQTPSRRRFHGFVHDAEARTLERSRGEPLTLTTAENRLLCALLDRPGQVLSRDQLLDLTAGREAKPYDRAIDNQVSRLRRKLGDDPRRPELIVTEWGGGYRFAGTVSTADENAP